MSPLKLWGGILLIVGTSIGGGMLALPIANGGGGFFPSTLLLFCCWAIMTFSAFLILEVNLWHDEGANVISMAKSTMGPLGAVLSWLLYLVLLYSLLCAYISGGSNIFNNIISLFYKNPNQHVLPILFVLLFGSVVFTGMKSVDWLNRLLMLFKLGSFILLAFLILPHVKINLLKNYHPQLLFSSIIIMITSFGYSAIIPSLRSYFNSDVSALRRAIWIGSLIPLGCYILWDGVIMGVIPALGNHGLLHMFHSGQSNSDLINSLNMAIHSDWIKVFSRVFTMICVTTSFLALSMSLSDFLADGIKVKKIGKGKIIVFSLTLLPPLLIVLLDPGVFLIGLAYAGIACGILQALFPAVMAWRGRYTHEISTGYEVAGGKFSLLVLMLFSMIVIIIGIVQTVKF